MIRIKIPFVRKKLAACYIHVTTVENSTRCCAKGHDERSRSAPTARASVMGTGLGCKSFLLTSVVNTELAMEPGGPPSRGGPQVSTLGHPAAALATLAAAGCSSHDVLKKSGNFLARQLYNLQTNQTRADHWQAKIKS